MGFPFLLQKEGEGMSNLRTNYKDDVFTGKRKYNEIDNGDGSISFDDVTNYSQNGDTYGAAQINEANEIINNLDNNSYRQTDGAETAIADNDYFPFFDASANAKKKTLWSNLKSILTQLFAIKVHNSNSAGTYGAGNASYFGHVKLSDNYTTSAGAASASVGASSQAVNSTYNRFKGQLTANNKDIYMDYKNGKYGINTSANRGADTFIPFKSGFNNVTLYAGNGGSMTGDPTWNHTGESSMTLTLSGNGNIRATYISTTGEGEDASDIHTDGGGWSIRNNTKNTTISGSYYDPTTTNLNQLLAYTDGDSVTVTTWAFAHNGGSSSTFKFNIE